MRLYCGMNVGNCVAVLRPHPAPMQAERGVTRVREKSVKLGFVSAILADLSVDDVLIFAADEGFACVELMCWPPGGANRRYAGVTHIDVTTLTDAQAERIRRLVERLNIAIS